VSASSTQKAKWHISALIDFNNFFSFSFFSLFAFLYPLGYNVIMVTIRETKIYSRWFAALRDRKARARIQTRIDRLQLGILGDVKPVGEGISELRIDYGPGYRVYFVQRGKELVILLAGGDKSTQDKDIKTALDLARNI